jgi:hypothetical protein
VGRRVHDVREEDRREYPIDVPLARRRGAGDELLDDVEQVVVLADESADVEVARELDQTGARDVLGQVAAASDVHQRIAQPMDDQRRGLHRRQGGTHVHLDVAAQDLRRHPRGRRLPLVACDQPTRVVVLGQVLRKDPPRLPGAPLPLHALDPGVDERGRDADRVIVCLDDAREGAPQDQRAHPLRVRRREQDAERPALGEPDHRRRFDAGGVGNGSEIVHAVGGRARTERAIRQPRAALVEEHQSPHAREALEVVAEEGDLPHELDIGDEPRDEQDVGRSAADDLIRDAEVAASGVTGFRDDARHLLLFPRGFGHKAPGAASPDGCVDCSAQATSIQSALTSAPDATPQAD